MKFTSTLTLLFVAVTFFFSCKDKDVQSSNSSSSCKVAKVYSYDFTTGSIDDSAIYTYTDNKVSKVQLSSGEYYNLVYNGAYVTRRNFYSNSSSQTSSGFEQVTYNSDNTIQKIEGMEKATTGFAMTYRYDFTYTSGKLTKLTINDITNNIATKIEDYAYTYTGENITSTKYADYTGSGSTETITYAYDNIGNYFKKQNAQILLVDPFLASDGTSFPLILSANNASSISSSGITFQITYQTDDKQNLSSVKINNQTAIRYSYQCQ